MSINHNNKAAEGIDYTDVVSSSIQELNFMDLERSKLS